MHRVLTYKYTSKWPSLKGTASGRKDEELTKADTEEFAWLGEY
jgi:hypothetical protein